MSVLRSIWRRGPEPRVAPKKRPPRLLTPLGMLGHFAAQVAIITTVAALWKVSNDNHGILTVSDAPGSSFDRDGFHGAHFWTLAILWTAFPAWIMSLYSAYWSAMLEELKRCQVIVDLHRPSLSWLSQRPGSDKDKARTARQTLLLDYGGVPIWDSIKALRNRHFLLALCMALRASLWAAGGFAAAFLSVAVVPVTSPSEFRTTHRLDDYENGFARYSGLSVRPALDVVSAYVNYGGSLYPWTTATHSFLPFQATREGVAGNLSAITDAYSATLECTAYSAADLVRAGSVTYQLGLDGTVEIMYDIRDRNCRSTIPQVVTPVTPNITKTWVTNICSYPAGRFRYGIINAEFDQGAPFKLGSFTLLSCWPHFWRHLARVTVASRSANDTGEVLSVEVTTQDEFQPFFASSLLQSLPLYAVAEGNRLFDTDSIGSVTRTHASKARRDDPSGSNPQQVLESFQKVFSAVYATYVSAFLYSPSEASFSPGSVTVLEDRLFVVRSAAIVVITIVAIAYCTTLVLTAWVMARRDILAEHVDSLLGHALLLRDSHGVASYIAALDTSIKGGAAGPFVDVEGVDRVKQASRDSDAGLRDWKCWVDRSRVPVLRVENPAVQGPPVWGADSSTASVNSPGPAQVQNLPLQGGSGPQTATTGALPVTQPGTSGP